MYGVLFKGIAGSLFRRKQVVAAAAAVACEDDSEATELGCVLSCLCVVSDSGGSDFGQ